MSIQKGIKKVVKKKEEKKIEKRGPGGVLSIKDLTPSELTVLAIIGERRKAPDQLFREYNYVLLSLGRRPIKWGEFQDILSALLDKDMIRKVYIKDVEFWEVTESGMMYV
ncbi:MAG: hypothetical protein ACTSYT_05640 [Candidatus Asgardarchaeia archaeon]